METYGESDIKLLNSAAEVIRQRPGLFVGQLPNPMVWNLLVREALCLSLDEAASGFCDKIAIEVGADMAARIRDFGRGLPMEPKGKSGKPIAEVLLTQLFACLNAKQNQGIKAACCGDVGLAAVNALSLRLEARVYRDGAVWFQEYRQGEPVAAFRKVAETTETGFELVFTPDTQMLGPVEFEMNQLVEWLPETGLAIRDLKFGADQATGVQFLVMEGLGSGASKSL